MSRAPGKIQALVLPPPPEKYDPSDQREVRRLVEESARRLPDWSSVLSVPGLIGALSGIDGIADQLPYITAPDEMAVTTLTAFARTLLAALDAAAARAVLGVVIERADVVLATASLAALASEAGSVAMPASVLSLLVIAADTPCRVRLYGTDAASTADAARALGTAPAAGIGLLAEFDFSSGAGSVLCSPVPVLSNDETPYQKRIWYSVQNRSAGAASVGVTFTVLGMDN